PARHSPLPPRPPPRDAPVTHPLAGLRVVELAADVAGPYATKLLADGGADVVKVERPAGRDPMRRWTSSGVEVPPGEDGVLFRFLNASKQSVAIDWTTAAGRAELLDLVARADVVVESLGGIDWAAISACNRATSLVSISWFGRTGPWKDRTATDITVQASAGTSRC